MTEIMPIGGDGGSGKAETTLIRMELLQMHSLVWEGYQE